MSASVINHLFAIHEHPGTVVGIQVEFVAPILRRLEHTGPAHKKIVHQLRTGKSFGRALEVDVFVCSAQARFAVGFDGRKVLQACFHLEIFPKQARFQPLSGEPVDGNGKKSCDQNGSSFNGCVGHGQMLEGARGLSMAKPLESEAPANDWIKTKSKGRKGMTSRAKSFSLSAIFVCPSAQTFT